MSPKISLSPTAAVFAGLIVYFCDPERLTMILIPVICHEIGHWLVLRISGCRITALEAEFSGFYIRYCGTLSRIGEAAAAAAGPIAGLVYALSARCFGENWLFSAGLSLLLSAINLIPCLPLDGGRIAAALLDGKKARMLGIISAWMSFIAGLYILFSGKGAAIILIGSLLVFGLERFYGSSSETSPD